MSPDFVTSLMHLSGMILVIASFAMLATPQLLPCVRFYAMHSFLLAWVTALVAVVNHAEHLLIPAVLTVGLKTFLIPNVFSRMIRRLGIRREVESYVNIPFTLLLSVLLVFVSFYVTSGLNVLASSALARQFAPIAIATMLLGMLMMTTRKKAVTQVLGLLLMENGIFLMAMTITFGMPLLVELGIFFDVLVAVMIMGIFVFKIRSAFEGIDVDEMTVLKG